VANAESTSTVSEPTCPLRPSLFTRLGRRTGPFSSLRGPDNLVCGKENDYY